MIEMTKEEPIQNRRCEVCGDKAELIHICLKRGLFKMTLTETLRCFNHRVKNG